MNHAYRLVWSDTTQRYVPAPETAKGRGKSSSSSRSAAIVALGAALLVTSAWAGPTSGTVSAGSGSINQSGTATTITQSSQNLAINWASFNVSAGESVKFVQPNASAIALNRVLGTDASSINGSLSANGQVWILNPNGVLFGSSASVNVGGLVASTLSLSDADFLAGKRSFSGDGSQGSVVNQGSLTGGYVALLGKQARNEGTITTANGTAALAAGDKITLDFSGNQLLSVQVDEATLNALAENKGLIRADNGTVILTASAKDALLDTVVNNEGVIEAKGIDAAGGTILLLGGFNGGTVKVGGTLDASASGANSGGFIETSGAHVQVADGAKISTLSDTGKTGTWLIDPTDFTISAGSGSQTTSGIGADTLAINLTTTSVTLSTDNSTGTDSGDINVNAAVSWSANTTLTLNAYNNINVNATITATGASAGLVLNYGDYATTGIAPSTFIIPDYNVKAPITLSGASASLSINGSTYKLLHSMADLTALYSTAVNGHYALAEDLDASGTTYTRALMGSSSIPFGSTFAGLGHTISNLTINASAGYTQYVGLFGYTNIRSVIRDIGLVGVNVSGQVYVGGLVGENYFGRISNAYVTGSVSGDYYIGGLVGWNYYGTIRNAYAIGSVSGYDYVGGLVGRNNGDISNAYATGSVSGYDYVGGLVGENSNGGDISNAYATGNVSGSSYVGGLAGHNDGGGTSRFGRISNSYWDSGSTGQSTAVGVNAGTVTNVSAVTSSNAYSHNSYPNLGYYGTWSETASGSGVWVAQGIGGNDWVLIEGSTRPFLYSEYSTSIRNAHQLQLMAVDTGASYTLVGNIDAGETSGSNASGMWSTAGFAPVGNSTVAFTGSLAGNRHSVNDLTINRASTDYVGLFGYTGSTSVISNVALVDASVSGGSYVGALAGYNTGSISNSSVTGTVTGTYFVGGLVGENDGSIGGSYATAAVGGSAAVGGLVGDNYGGSISGSYATGAVTGGDYLGGLAGGNEGSITDSYASGAVTGSGNYVGGLVGDNYMGSIGTSYASGAVVSSGSNVGGLVGGAVSGSVTASFWNTETSGQSSSAGGTGITTAQMLQASTFSDAGWDIASNGGSSAVWRIYDGYTAPLLRSFMTALTVTAGDASKTYDGSTAVSSSYTLSDSSADTSLIRGTAAYSTSSKNVGSYSLGVSGLYSSQQGYDLSVVDGTATITAATLTVSGTTTANKTYDGTTAAALSGSLSGLVSGDTVTLSQSGTFSDKNAATGKTVSYTSSLSGSDAGNYVLASSSGTTTADISAATLTVRGTTASNKTYDGTTGATLSGGSLSGLISGDTVMLGQSGRFSDKNAATGKTVSYTSTLSGSDAGNYVLASSSGTTTADITAATLTVSGTTAANKTYDGTTATTLSGATLSGVIIGDSITLGQSGTFSDKNAASGKTVSYTSSLSGSDTGNYVLASNSGTTTADITAATLTVSGSTAANKTYDGTTAASLSGGALSGVISGDTVALSQSGTFSNKNAATGKTVSYTSSLSGTDAGNYVLASSTGTTTANITAATLTVSGSTAANKTYDGTTAATVNGGALSGVISGDTVALSQSGTFSNKNAATGKTVTIANSLSGSDAGNYVVAAASTTADIAAATLTVSGTTAANKTYDGTTTATLSGATLSGVIIGDSITLGQSGTFSDKNAASGKTVSYTSNLSGGDAGNYVLASSSGSTTANITAAALTVTVNNDSRIANGSAYSGGNGVSYSGLVGGDTSSVLGGSLVYGGTSQGATTVGSYSITASGLSASNYVISYVNGTLVIRSATDSRVTDALSSLYRTPSSDARKHEAGLFGIDNCGIRLAPSQSCNND